MKKLLPKSIEFRSIEDKEIEAIRKYQNGECREDVSELLDFDPSWAPMSLDQIKTKVDEIRKKDRTALFSVWSKGDEFIGLGLFSAEWDTWFPYIHVVIWPEHRRKGYGTNAARLLLETSFNRYLAHVVGCYIPELNEGGLAFAKVLGFKRQGVKRRAGIVNGKYFDGVFLSILRNDYFAQRSKGVDA